MDKTFLIQIIPVTAEDFYVYERILMIVEPFLVGILYCIQMIAAIAEDFSVGIKDVVSVSGNDAILTCQPPPEMEQLVTISAWQRDDRLDIFPSLLGGKTDIVYLRSFISKDQPKTCEFWVDLYLHDHK